MGARCSRHFNLSRHLSSCSLECFCCRFIWIPTTLEQLREHLSHPCRIDLELRFCRLGGCFGLLLGSSCAELIEQLSILRCCTLQPFIELCSCYLSQFSSIAELSFEQMHRAITIGIPGFLDFGSIKSAVVSLFERCDDLDQLIDMYSATAISVIQVKEFVRPLLRDCQWSSSIMSCGITHQTLARSNRFERCFKPV